MADPFAPVDLTIHYVNSASGSGKSLSAVALALEKAKSENRRTLFACPTLELVRELVEFARRDTSVPVVEISSRRDKTVPRRFTTSELLRQAISGRNHQGGALRGHLTCGHLVFATHETLHRMLSWPPETADWHLVIDEAPETVLTRPPFKLRSSGYVLTSFLTTVPAPVSAAQRAARRAAAKAGVTVFTERDVRLMERMQAILRPSANASQGERDRAAEHVERLTKKREDAAAAANDHSPAALLPYYVVVPKLAPDGEGQRGMDPFRWLMDRVLDAPFDDVFALLAPVPQWLAGGCALFSEQHAWDRMAKHTDFNHDRGRITIAGIRRPDQLAAFARVTVMSALLPYTYAYQVWDQLGVTLKPSDEIRVSEPTTPLGQRRLRIYWLCSDGWSKRRRDRSGGIEPIFELIAKSGVLNPAYTTCVQSNKDDASDADPSLVRRYFGRDAIVLPHNVGGRNDYRAHHQMVHTAALNSYTSDILWIEGVLGIDAASQRIARTGQAIYQALMRTSLRDPTSSHDVVLVVMDADVALWLKQWFVPGDQVEVGPLDGADSVIRAKLKPGRPRIGTEAMSSTERSRRRRNKRRDDGLELPQ